MTIVYGDWTEWGWENEESLVQWGCRRGRHAVSEFRRAVRVKIAIKDSKRSNITTKRNRLKTVCQRRRINETNSF